LESTNPENGPRTSEARKSKRVQQAISSDLRERFANYVTSTTGISISAAARTYGLAVSTAHAIMRRYEATGATKLKKKGGARVIKLTQDAKNALNMWISERPDVTLQNLCDRLASEYSISVTKQTVSEVLKKAGFTIKLLRALPVSRNCPETLLARAQYAQKYLSEAPPDHRHIIWIDECGFNLHIRRKYGRSRRGETAAITVANGRGQNISACAAMSEEGFLFEKLRPGAYNAIHFCEFLEQLFELLNRMERPSCWLVLDNVRFHHSQEVSLMAQRYGHTLVFLPPYSPMLNPIESLFGKWKTLIRTQGVALSLDSLLLHMSAARCDITVNDCLGWIRDTNRNIGLSLQMHIFH
jgi:transposase